MEKDIIKKILGISINVLTDKDEKRTLSLYDFLHFDSNEISISIDRDMNRTPRCRIDLHIECDNFSLEFN